MPVQFIELYRFLYAVCMNLHFAAFEGFERDDIWQERFVPPGADIMAIRQVAENVGGLFPLVSGGNRYRQNGIEENLLMLEDLLCQLLEAYPHITYMRGSFRQVHPLYRLNSDDSAPEYHGDRPNLDVWHSILKQEEPLAKLHARI